MCYESLSSGCIGDGITDLTGIDTEKIDLHDEQGVFPNSKLNGEGRFWKYLVARRSEKSILS
jgi:hypothetical protein